MRTKNLLAIVGLALLAFIGGSAAYAADTHNPDAIINVGSLFEPLNLDNTAGAGQGINEAFNSNVYEGLFRLTDSGDVEKQLVKSYTVSEDGLIYTFTLLPSVTFHSGAPLTAADVKYSIERTASSGSKSSRKSTLAPIKSIETPDDLTVVIELSTRSFSLPYNLTYVWIVNRAATDLMKSADGTGPYKLENWQRGARISLKRFDGYHGTAPSNKGVIFTYFTDATALSNALLTGSVDIVTSLQNPDALTQFKDTPDFTVSEGKSTTKEVLAFNDRIEPFNNPKVRKAITRAIDRQKLLTSLWGEYGTVIGSFVPPTDPWYEDLTDINAYNSEAAKMLLTEAGFEKGFSFTLDTPSYDPHQLVAQFVKSELAKIGIDVKINVITSNEWYSKIYKAHDFQATLQEHVNHRDITFYGNPDFYWGYNNPTVIQLMKDAENSLDEAGHTSKMRDANRLIAEEAASTWLFLAPQIVVSRSSVTGYPVNGLNSQFFVGAIKKTK